MHTEGSHPHHTKLLSPGLGDALLLAFDKLAHRLPSGLLPSLSGPFTLVTIRPCILLYLLHSSPHNLEIIHVLVCMLSDCLAYLGFKSHEGRGSLSVLFTNVPPETRTQWALSECLLS